ncbi:aminoglycoside phosphotransferase family protein [Actinacidiphila acidipaludis]|uniref:Aminoglycoside phosphotransferase family protein n=1 Tax=Actinacidiphila acidipaludis TaxID=2873382 RepID=A0ABS7Q8M1_9ACTN|nr:aminoglycoside phosphotransferase family protein [Streptomyces acidipaludis]MBY8879506.1 aminoglycoside phosphotransferase family protein [Streptomyces acidipaludis]
MGSGADGGGPEHVELAPPERLARTVAAWEGDAGRVWLAELPGRVAGYLDRWRLTPERVFAAGGQISMIVLVRTEDGTPAVLKVGMITRETAQEHAALAHWEGRGAVRLLRADAPEGVLLLERLQADVSLRSLAEPRAMLEAEALLQRLWVPPADAHPFTSVADHTAFLAGTLRERREQEWAADARPLIDEALALRDELLAGASEEFLLHGDYHHGNVLAGERMAWLAIDPKPLVGERAYDLAWLARDRLATLAAQPGPRSAARRRVAALASALDVDPERLRGWALFRSVEAGVWYLSVDGQEDGQLLLEFASWL